MVSKERKRADLFTPEEKAMLEEAKVLQQRVGHKGFGEVLAVEVLRGVQAFLSQFSEAEIWEIEKSLIKWKT